MGWPSSVGLTFDFYLVICIGAVTGVTRKVNRDSAAVPQPGRDSINGDVDSLHELVVRRGRIGWSRPMAP
jgi:hypothetical protein